MVDMDGKSKLSGERMVEITEGLTLGEAQPNPSKEEVRFATNLAMGTKADITIYDAAGKAQQLTYTNNEKEIIVNLNGISSGMYTLVIKSGTQMITKQFTVVK
jgi:hypothetical protein